MQKEHLRQSDLNSISVSITTPSPQTNTPIGYNLKYRYVFKMAQNDSANAQKITEIISDLTSIELSANTYSANFLELKEQLTPNNSNNDQQQVMTVEVSTLFVSQTDNNDVKESDVISNTYTFSESGALKPIAPLNVNISVESTNGSSGGGGGGFTKYENMTPLDLLIDMTSYSRTQEEIMTRLADNNNNNGYVVIHTTSFGDLYYLFTRAITEDDLQSINNRDTYLPN